MVMRQEAVTRRGQRITYELYDAVRVRLPRHVRMSWEEFIRPEQWSANDHFVCGTVRCTEDELVAVNIWRTPHVRHGLTLWPHSHARGLRYEVLRGGLAIASYGTALMPSPWRQTTYRMGQVAVLQVGEFHVVTHIEEGTIVIVGGGPRKTAYYRSYLNPETYEVTPR